jgi:hypothetical protein
VIVAIELRCECGHEFQAAGEVAGRPVLCPLCWRGLVVPQAELPPDGESTERHDERPSRMSRKALASLMMGLCGFVAAFGTTGIPLVILVAFCVAGVPAIIVGTLALRDIKNPSKRVMGKGSAIAGIALGTLTTILAVLTPLAVEGREPARRAMCANNLKSIAMAMWNYESVFGSFPPAAIFDRDGSPLLSWRVLLLPYLEHGELYNQFHLDEPWDSPHNRPLADKMPRVFQCPSGELRQGFTTYEVFVEPHSMFTGKPSGVTIKDVTDGSSHTLLIVETTQPVPWTKPGGLSLASSEPGLGMGSNHPSGFHVSMADESIRFISISGQDGISPRDLRAMVTRDANDLVDAP